MTGTGGAALRPGAVASQDDEYRWAGVEDPKVMVTTSRDPSARLKKFAKASFFCGTATESGRPNEESMEKLEKFIFFSKMLLGVQAADTELSEAQQGQLRIQPADLGLQGQRCDRLYRFARTPWNS